MNRELREEILKATFNIYRKKGLKFTMDDVAGQISISKKTIYNIFRSKDELFIEMVDYFFDRVKEVKKEIFRDEQLNTEQKFKKILVALPDGVRDMDLRHLYILRDKYPGVYRQLQKRLEIDWENTVYLIHKGVEEGVFRPFDLTIFQMILQTAIEHFFQSRILFDKGIDYHGALDSIADILVYGVMARDEDRNAADNH